MPLEVRYDVRPSVWHGIAERSHLIVAGIGSAVMLGLAGTAIWLALPSDTADQIVSPVQAAPRVASASAIAAPTSEPDPAPAANTIADLKPAAEQKPAPGAVMAAAEQPTPEAATPGDVEPLDQTDPRWTSAAAGHAARTAAAPSRAKPPEDDSKSVATAYAEDAGTADKASTAAIPAAKPAQDADKAAETPAPEEKVASAGRPGRTARAVTMRARPSSRGGVLGTVPGSADVQVVSCDQWCEIVYKGKRGFVYRSFLRNNGR
jgi:hypothetical protein